MPLIIEVVVKPNSGKSLCTLDKSGNLTCFLKSPPEKGRANKELIKLLAKALRITQQAVEIIGGATSRKKRLYLETHKTFDDVLHALGIEKQMNMFN